MKIKNITIGNYKNIAETVINLSTITALVSTNNYGKSNLLEAIRFGFDFITESAKTRNQMMRWVLGIPLSSGLAGKDFKFSIEFDEPALAEYRYVKYGYTFSWENDQKSGAAITDETIEIRPDESTRYTSFLKRGKGLYRAGKNKSGFRKIVLGKDVLAVDVLSSIDDIEIADVIAAIQKLHCTICDTLELSSSYHPIPIEFNYSKDMLPFNDEDIPRALNILQKEHPEQYALFLEIIYGLFPEFEDISLQSYQLSPSIRKQLELPAAAPAEEGEDAAEEVPYHIKDEIYRLMIRSKYLNQPISMEYMSTGTKRIIWLVANSLFGRNYSLDLIGVDEIETSIHPKMIRNLLEALDEALADTSMILTSHSPYLIQYLKPESIYIGVPNDSGMAEFKRIDKRKVKDLLQTTRDLGISIGEYIFELMSGDEDSLAILQAYLEK